MKIYGYLNEMKTNPKFIAAKRSEDGQTQFLSADLSAIASATAEALAKADFVSNFEYTKIVNA